MPKIIGYARVSTDEQALNSHALEQQIERLRQNGAEAIYFDVLSGGNNDRQEYQKVLALVADNAIEKVIATRLDRLTRNEEGYLFLKNLFKTSNVKLFLLDQGEVDLSTASGELTSDIQCIMAVGERRMIRERVKFGFKHRRDRQAACRPPFGYTVVTEKYQLDRRPIICLLAERPDNYQDLSQELELHRLPGKSKSDIAKDIVNTFREVKHLKKTVNAIYEKYGLVPLPKRYSGRSEDLILPRSTTHLREWLTNPVLEGHTAYLKYRENGSLKPRSEWDIRENTHPQERLITPEEQEEINDIIALSRKEIGFRERTSFLTGLVYCAECGNKSVFKTSHKAQYKYYGCRYSKQGCSNHQNTTLENIDKAIIKAIFTRAHTLHEQGESKLYLTNSKELSDLKEQLVAVEAVPNFENNLLLKNARQELLRNIDRLTQSLQNNVFSDGNAQQMINHPHARNLTFWYSLTETERSHIYYKLVDKVFVSHKSVFAVHLKV